MIPLAAIEAAYEVLPIDSYVAGHAHVRAMLEAAAPHMLASIATRLRELPFEELQSDIVPRDWPECLNVHNVINDVADWITK